MPPPLLQLQDISLSFGVMPLLSGATLAVAAGDRICLVGRNGSGKSTLLRIAAGLVQADTGERFAQPGATIQYLPQELDLAGFGTTLAYVEAGFDSATADRRHRALYLLKELGLSGDEDPASLSGGEARRAALACALAPSPDASCQIWPVNEVTARLGLPPGHAREEQTLAEIEDFIDWGARATPLPLDRYPVSARLTGGGGAFGGAWGGAVASRGGAPRLCWSWWHSMS